MESDSSVDSNKKITKILLNNTINEGDTGKNGKVVVRVRKDGSGKELRVEYDGEDSGAEKEEEDNSKESEDESKQGEKSNMNLQSRGARGNPPTSLGEGSPT